MDSSLKEQIIEANTDLHKEVQKWQELQVDPNQIIQINALMLDTYVNALAQFLVEKGAIEDEEFTLFFKKKMLEVLKMHRENVTPLVQAERRKQAGIDTFFAIPKDMKH